MNAVHDVRARLRAAEGVTAILAAAHDAFEWMLPVLEGHEDPAGAMFAAFVTAGAAAADGRDALAFAPSLPAASRISGGPAVACGRQAGPDRGSDAYAAGAAVAVVCALLVSRLAEAGSLAADRGDQVACADAGRSAGKVRRLLTGDGP